MNRRTSADPAPRSFVVRIYRRTANGLVGQVQDVMTGRVRVFRDLTELWAALGGPRGSSGTRKSNTEET